MFLVVCFLAVMQWLSIWAGVAKIDKNDKPKRKKLFCTLLCTMGIPAIIAVVLGIVVELLSFPSWISLVVLVVLDIVFLFCGKSLCWKIFGNLNKIQNHHTYGKKYKKKKKHRHHR